MNTGNYDQGFLYQPASTLTSEIPTIFQIQILGGALPLNVFLVN